MGSVQFCSMSVFSRHWEGHSCNRKCSVCKCPIFFKTAMDWIVSPTNSYVEALIPSLMVFEDGAFAKWSGHLIRWGHDGVGALVPRDTREPVFSLSLPCENVVRRQPCASQEKGLLMRTWPCRHPDPGHPASGTEKSVSVVETTRCMVFSYGSPSSRQKPVTMVKCFSVTIISHQHILWLKLIT